MKLSYFKCLACNMLYYFPNTLFISIYHLFFCLAHFPNFLIFLSVELKVFAIWLSRCSPDKGLWIFFQETCRSHHVKFFRCPVIFVYFRTRLFLFPFLMLSFSAHFLQKLRWRWIFLNSPFLMFCEFGDSFFFSVAITPLIVLWPSMIQTVNPL